MVVLLCFWWAFLGGVGFLFTVVDMCYFLGVLFVFACFVFGVLFCFVCLFVYVFVLLLFYVGFFF